jgi:alkylation response protein AidB-like acyl-CoA dehydrogenase
MNYRTSDEDRELLRTSVRRLLEHEWPMEKAPALTRDAVAVQRVTRRLAELGLLSIGRDVGEGGLSELLLVLQELGRASCPAPVLSASLFNILLASYAGGIPVSWPAAIQSGRGYAALALGDLDGDRTAGRAVLNQDRLKGEVRYLDAAAGVTHLLAVVSPEEIALAELQEAAVDLVATRAVGAQGLATLRLHDVPATSIRCEPQLLNDLALLARLGAVARAYGAAARAFELLVDYVKERKQFGRPVGSFQAIQHKLANNFIALEGVRLSLANVASHYDRGMGEWRVFASSVCANAGQALRQLSLETHHAFGAIGYAEEHEAPRHFKQVHQDVLRHGGARRAREELAAHFLDQGHPLPDYDFGEVANALRGEIRNWLREHWTPERQARLQESEHPLREYDPEFARELGNAGWMGLNWPKRFGGRDGTPLEYFAFVEEMARADAPRAGAQIQAVAWMLFGSQDQQRRYLPELLRGEPIYGMWFSEPDAGSDLASMRTRAVLDGDHFIINGQKIWTTTYWGDYMWLAARTDPDAKAHAGLSVFCIPTNTPGITIRPVKTMYDGEFVNTFFDNVRIPANALVGELNGGWQVLTESLRTERGIVGGIILAKLARSFEMVCQYIRTVRINGVALNDDPVVRDTIGGFAAQLDAGRSIALHCARAAGQGETPAHDAAICKVFGGELMERFFEATQDILGMEAALSRGSEGAILHGQLEQKLRHALMWVISIGTNEIQRTVIAQHGLGLPR